MVCSGWWVVFGLCAVNPDSLRSRTSEAGLAMSLVSNMLLFVEIVSMHLSRCNWVVLCVQLSNLWYVHNCSPSCWTPKSDSQSCMPPSSPHLACKRAVSRLECNMCMWLACINCSIQALHDLLKRCCHCILYASAYTSLVQRVALEVADSCRCTNLLVLSK